MAEVRGVGQTLGWKRGTGRDAGQEETQGQAQGVPARLASWAFSSESRSLRPQGAHGHSGLCFPHLPEPENSR